MCGILAILEDVVDKEKVKKLCGFIDRRGPDYKSDLLHHRSLCGKKIVFYSSILHLRGQNVQKQPLVNRSGNLLLFNGQIYKFEGKALTTSESDTCFLMEKLDGCETSDQIIQQLRFIDGPFAFIYWNNQSNTLFFGRDIFGRKSLCKLTDDADSNYILLSSIGTQDLESPHASWSEISCDGFYAMKFDGFHRRSIKKYEWVYDIIYPPTDKCKISQTEQNTTTIKISCDHIEKLNYALDSPESLDEEEKHKNLNLLENYFLDAVRLRIFQQRRDCLDCRKQKVAQYCNHAKFAVAFSGGLDSTMLALALDKLIDRDESIDLLTCAFKANSPDRESVGLATRELIKISPSRKWRLVIGDIDLDELIDRRNDTIMDLIWPCNTVIDYSLGCACWFIGRGKGRSIVNLEVDDMLSLLPEFLKWNSEDNFSEILNDYIGFQSSYICPASIIFAGSSIDEQLGGYSSHRTAWSRSGAKGLIDEISFQMRRLPTRNLGRDDRVYSDHGRDLKLPYLDFKLVSFLNQLPVGQKMDLDLGLEIGPKMILRRLALRWGLVGTAHRVKRAMQFGTKIAKLENMNERGDEICARLTKVDQ